MEAVADNVLESYNFFEDDFFFLLSMTKDDTSFPML